jgi:hypothetical protein
MRRIVILVGLLLWVATAAVAERADCPPANTARSLLQVLAAPDKFAGCPLEIEANFLMRLDAEHATRYSAGIPPTYFENYDMFLVADLVLGGEVFLPAFAHRDQRETLARLTAGQRVKIATTPLPRQVKSKGILFLDVSEIQLDFSPVPAEQLRALSPLPTR